MNTVEVDIKRPRITAQRSYGLVEVVPEEKRYQGEYVVTPSQSRQTLPTTQRYLEHDVVVEPIPEYYGLIAYNGITLTVS